MEQPTNKQQRHNPNHQTNPMNKHKNHHHHHHQEKQTKPPPDAPFKPCSAVKGLRFGGQLVIKSFTVRRAAPLELARILSLPSQHPNPFPSTAAFFPTNFSILAQQAWRTITLGLGTKKSKILLFVFESESLKSVVERIWPSEIPLGEVNRRLIRGLSGCEMARFKFRKGAVTFYVFAVRREGDVGFSCADDLRRILQAVVALKDFLDHTAMLALPQQRSIGFAQAPVAMAY